MTRKMRSAYTLTELLVATAVGSIVMAMAFSSFRLLIKNIKNIQIYLIFIVAQHKC